MEGGDFLNKAEQLFRESTPYDAMGDYSSLLTLVRKKEKQSCDREDQLCEDGQKTQENKQ